MYYGKYSYIWNSRDLFCKVNCQECGEEGAIFLMADCNGDGMYMCPKHWREYIERMIDDCLSPKTDENFYETESEEYPNIVVYKRKDVKK